VSARAQRPTGLAAGLVAALALASVGCAHRSEAGGEARQAVIEANIDELQACWDDLAGEYPGAKGSLLFAVELRRNGSVNWVEVPVDELGSPKLIACTVRRIKRWQFPADRKPRSIQFGVGFVAP